MLPVLKMGNAFFYWLATGQWFSLVSGNNKSDRHDITEILLKMALNNITLTQFRSKHIHNLIECARHSSIITLNKVRIRSKDWIAKTGYVCMFKLQQNDLNNINLYNHYWTHLFDRFHMIIINVYFVTMFMNENKLDNIYTMTTNKTFIFYTYEYLIGKCM